VSRACLTPLPRFGEHAPETCQLKQEGNLVVALPGCVYGFKRQVDGNLSSAFEELHNRQVADGHGFQKPFPEEVRSLTR
jgi:hypothetical protein